MSLGWPHIGRTAGRPATFEEVLDKAFILYCPPVAQVILSFLEEYLKVSRPKPFGKLSMEESYNGATSTTDSLGSATPCMGISSGLNETTPD